MRVCKLPSNAFLRGNCSMSVRTMDSDFIPLSLGSCIWSWKVKCSERKRQYYLLFRFKGFVCAPHVFGLWNKQNSVADIQYLFFNCCINIQPLNIIELDLNWIYYIFVEVIIFAQNNHGNFLTDCDSRLQITCKMYFPHST